MNVSACPINVFSEAITAEFRMIAGIGTGPIGIGIGGILQQSSRSNVTNGTEIEIEIGLGSVGAVTVGSARHGMFVDSLRSSWSLQA